MFDKLEWISTSSTYRITHKDQSYHTFIGTGSSLGLLTEIVDATGNKLTIERDTTNDVFKIIDAAGRQLHMEYNSTSSKLTRIYDPGYDDGIPQSDILDVPAREWNFLYFGKGAGVTDEQKNKLKCLKFPLRDGESDNDRIDFDWIDGGRIKTMSDRYHWQSSGGETPHLYTFEYETNGMISKVTDPTPSVGSPLDQEFTTYCYGSDGYYVDTSYLDRRESVWVYSSYRPQPIADRFWFQLLSVENPLSEVTAYTFNASNLLVSFRDALNRGWDYTYHTNGNRIQALDPNNTDRDHQWTYDQYNNVKTYHDPAGNVTTYTYHYEEVSGGYPTLLTKIDEPPLTTNGPVASTTMTYFLEDTLPPTCDPESPTDACKHGQLKKITDPNDVETFFDYDMWGQQSQYVEGVVTIVVENQPETENVYQEDYVEDGRSRRKTSEWTCGVGGTMALAMASSSGSGGSMSYNPLNLPTGSSCDAERPLRQPTGTPPAWRPPLPTSEPSYPLVSAEWLMVDYDGFGRIISDVNRVHGLSGACSPCDRDFSDAYDELGRTTLTAVINREPFHVGASNTRDFTYTYDTSAGTVTRKGPDDVDTYYEYDAANRLTMMRRGTEQSPLMTAEYIYNANGLPYSVTYGNGTVVGYVYDSANRVTNIDTITTGSQAYSLTYTYDDRDLPLTITESNSTTTLGTTTYTYDSRGRLTGEVRTHSGLYNLSYVYDDGGNRTKKTNTTTNRETIYTYDTSDPETFGSHNNRLMKAEEYDTDPDPAELLNTTWYLYDCAGNVERVVKYVEQATTPKNFSATRFVYGKNGRTVTFIADETWEEDGSDSGSEVDNYSITVLREYRYDTGRARYLARKYNPSRVMANLGEPDLWSVWDGEHPNDPEQVVEVFTDYEGDEPYGDWYRNPANPVVNTFSYEPGQWRSDLVGETSEYLHNDHLGTLRQSSNANGVLGTNRIYSSFGERIAGPTPPDRYGYVGAHGYQTHDDLPFQHLGARYYDPSSGRFLQRDPIGIEGDLNVYSYADNSPLALIDPDGFAAKGRDKGRYDDPYGQLNEKQLDDAYDAARKNNNQRLAKRIKQIQKMKGYRNKQKRNFDYVQAPWWARVGQHFPVPDPQNVPKWQRRLNVGAACILIPAAAVTAPAAAGAAALAL